MNAPGRQALVGAGLLGTALVTQIATRSTPSLVETVYSRRVYPWFPATLGRAASLVPFSVAEVLLVGLALLLVVATARTLLRLAKHRQRWVAVLAGTASGALMVSGLGYWLFLLAWGFNYARQPLADTIGLGVRPEAVPELALLATALVEQANREREGLSEDTAGVLRIKGGLGSVAERLDQGYAAAARRYSVLAGRSARPKPVLLSPILSRLGIAGIYSPFTGEPNVNTTLPDPELPFSAAHELAHQHGFAREDEANYLGYLSCRLHPDADFRYSGLLAASHYVLGALLHVDRPAAERIGAMRSAAVRRDDLALQAWADRYRGRATEIGRRVNDAYLRTQGQAEGVRSYGRMVDLLLAERRAAVEATTDALVRERR